MVINVCLLENKLVLVICVYSPMFTELITGTLIVIIMQTLEDHLGYFLLQATTSSNVIVSPNNSVNKYSLLSSHAPKWKCASTLRIR